MIKVKIWIVLFIVGIVMILGASEFSRFLANEINWYTAGIIFLVILIIVLKQIVNTLYLTPFLNLQS